MDVLIPVLSMLGGLVLLVAGGEFLVRGASALAAALKIPPLVVGLTVVAFGTSAPELAVSLQAAFSGTADLALGNVVGSNICNVLLILGLSAAVAPLVVSSRLVRFDVPLVVGASVLLLFLGLDGSVGRAEGLLLVALVIGYTVRLVVSGRRDGLAAEAAVPAVPGVPGAGDGGGDRRLWLQLGLILAGLVLLGLGSRFLVAGAVKIASLMGMSDLVIGLTIVAIGTSLPELVTSVVASLRGQRDIAVGNVVGSNLFNLLAVLGLTAIFSPDGVAVPRAALAFDIPVMIAVAVACLPVFFTGGVIARWEGFLFLGFYVLYTTWLVIGPVASPATRTFGAVALWFLLPLGAVTLVVTGVAGLRRGASGPPSR